MPAQPWFGEPIGTYWAVKFAVSVELVGGTVIECDRAPPSLQLAKAYRLLMLYGSCGEIMMSTVCVLPDVHVGS